MISRSAFFDLKDCSASKTTAAGSEPSFCAMTSVSIRFPHSFSCSIAPARKVSAAARITRFP